MIAALSCNVADPPNRPSLNLSGDGAQELTPEQQKAAVEAELKRTGLGRRALAAQSAK